MGETRLQCEHLSNAKFVTQANGSVGHKSHLLENKAGEGRVQ